MSMGPFVAPQRSAVEDLVVAAYAAGKPVPVIASWYDMPEADVYRMIGGEPPAPRKSRRGLLVGSVIAGVVLLATAGMLWVILRPDGLTPAPGASPSIAANRAALQSAKSTCSPATEAVRVTDGGTTLLFDGYGEEDFAGAPSIDLTCIMGALSAPESVQSRMQHTRALDGRQEDTWPGFSASWTYHPDNGLDLIVKVV